MIQINKINVQKAIESVEKSKIFFENKIVMDSQKVTPERFKKINLQRSQAILNVLQEFDLKEAVNALERLANFASQDSGGSSVYTIANFLVGLYNGKNFDLTNFRSLDNENFSDCIKVIRLMQPPIFYFEPHRYFENGDEIFANLITKLQGK